jgi:hypothetical protein
MIFGFWNLAVAAPLLGTLARNPTFLVVRGMRTGDILLFVLILCAVLPGFLALAHRLLEMGSSRARTAFSLALFSLLVLLLALPYLKTVFKESFVGPVLLGAAITGWVILTCFRYSWIRTGVRALSLAAAGLPILFLLLPAIRPLLFAGNARIPHVKVTSRTPVVLVIFDELALNSLLDDKLQIQASRFPNFHWFAQHSTWFRATSSVSADSVTSITSILTGTHVRGEAIPTLHAHPRNLFTILGRSYSVHAIELMTHLSAMNTQEHPGQPGQNVVLRTCLLFEDLSLIYLHIVSPSSLEERLPPVNTNWGDFLHRGTTPLGAVRAFPDVDEVIPRFLALLSQDDGKPSIYFAHVMLPHGTWRYLPSGRRYTLLGPSDALLRNTILHYPDPDVVRGWQRHLLQVGYADRVLGEFVAQMKEVDLFDRALIVITADHGLTFYYSQPCRKTCPQNYGDVLAVPLLIKLPYQKEGRVLDIPTESIDILPTILDVLKVSVPWRMDGHSALDPNFPRRKNRPWSDKILYPVDLFGGNTISRKLQLFGSDWDSLYRSGPRPDVLGQPVDSVQPTDSTRFRVLISGESEYENVSLESPDIPCFVSGRVARLRQTPGAPPNLVVGIAVNGVFRATTRTATVLNRKDFFAALVPESAFRPGKNTVEVRVLPSQ